MIPTQKEKLLNFEHTCIGIGITSDGVGYSMFNIPWESTAHAFNMRTPDIYFAPEDMYDPEIIELLGKYKVIGCYIFTEMEDYSFLEQFTDMQDLHIRYGKNLKNLSFMKNMKEWFMLYIEDAHLDNLDAAFDREEKRCGFYSYCVGFCNCKIEDVSAIAKSGVRLSELLIWNTRKDMDYEKWKGISALTKRCYLLRDF